jgi:hypothetical protein
MTKLKSPNRLDFGARHWDLLRHSRFHVFLLVIRTKRALVCATQAPLVLSAMAFAAGAPGETSGGFLAD